MALKYKVGDKVKYGSEICTVTKIIESQGKFKYRVQSDSWFDIINEEEIIEGLVEDTITINEPLLKPVNISLEKEMEWNLPNGYIFKDENGNIINATKIVLEKKKKEYPKTYEECCKVLGYDDRETYCICHTGADERLFESMYRLKVCRDAYWKIAGEEMGLGKPWSPDYDSGVNKYGIICMNGVVQESNPTTNWERHLNKVLDFPTEEMRDAFKENFDADLEFCKELL